MSFGLGGALIRRGGVPLAVSVLVSDRCNHACAHCYQVHGQKGEMTFAEIERLLADLATASVLFLQLSGGEATLRPDLPDILRAARRHHFAITLLTNAYEISDELLDAIIETGVLAVYVSVYSDIAAEHDAVTRVRGSFARTTANVRRLRARGVRVEISSTLTSLCSATRERMSTLASDLGCTITMSPWITAREDGTTEPQRVGATTDQLHAHFRAPLGDAEPVETREEKLGEHPCGACGTFLTVHSDGSLRPCTHIPHALGTLGHESDAIRALADDEAFQCFAEVRWKDLHGCRDCDLVPWCSRCHGSAAQELGDLFGAQAGACRVAVARCEAQVGPLRRLPLASDAAPRSAEAGPFVLVDGGGLVPIADRITADDEQMRRRFPWILRPNRGARGLLPASRLVRRSDTRASVAYDDAHEERP